VGTGGVPATSHILSQNHLCKECFFKEVTNLKLAKIIVVIIILILTSAIVISLILGN
jgi:hypothetical protein